MNYNIWECNLCKNLITIVNFMLDLQLRLCLSQSFIAHLLVWFCQFSGWLNALSFFFPACLTKFSLSWTEEFVKMSRHVNLEKWAVCLRSQSFCHVHPRDCYPIRPWERICKCRESTIDVVGHLTMITWQMHYIQMVWKYGYCRTMVNFHKQKREHFGFIFCEVNLCYNNAL